MLEDNFVFSSSYIDISRIDIELDDNGFFSTWPYGTCLLVINVLSPRLTDVSSSRLRPNSGCL